MKKAIWWILGILLSPVLLFVILTILLYLPPVQNWAVDKLAAIASEKTGMSITVGHVRLSFPLDLSVSDFRVLQRDTLTAQMDTIADVQHMVVDVQLLPLFQNRVVISELEVTNTRLNTNGFVDAVKVKGDFRRLYLQSRGIDLDRQTVQLNGARLERARLDIAMNDSVPEDTTTTDNRWKILADSLTVIQGDVTFHTPGDTMSVHALMGHLVARQADIDLGTETYRVGSVDLADGSLRYDQNFELPIEGLDFNHLGFSDIRIGVDSVCYHDPTLRLYMRHVALKEQSGLEVSDLSGRVVMDNGRVTLPRFRLKTPTSDVYMELDMPLNLMDVANTDKLRLRLDAQLGRDDVLRFMEGLPQGVRDRWPRYPLSIKGVARGNMDFVEFSELVVDLPTAFHATATGFVANLSDMDRLRADVQLKAETQQLDFLMAALPRDVQRDYRIPVGIRVDGRVKADGPQYFADLTAREGRGVVRAKGSYDRRASRYDAKVQVRDLNLHRFMPHEALYAVSADITAKGHGTDIFSPRTTLVADAKIGHLRYDRWTLSNITAHADVRNGRAHADVVSHNPLLNGVVNIDALMQRQKFDATVIADINKADLYALGLMDNPLTVALCGHVDVSSDLQLSHRASGLFSDLTIRDSAKVYRPEDIGLLLNMRPDTVYARMQSGDFIVKLDAGGDYEQLLRQLTMLGDSISYQIGHNTIDQPALRRLLPTMKIHVESRQDNPVANLLKSGLGVSFKDLYFDMTSSVANGLNGNGHIHSLLVQDIRLDTISFRLTQHAERLSFGGQIRNNKKNPQFVFNALFDGVLQEHGATMGVRYYDSEGKMGARIGAQAEMVDSGINVRLVPERPTLGYKLFNLNPDNYLFYGRNNRVRANVDLVADDGTGVKIYSDDRDATALQDITVSLNHFNLDEITSVIPYTPRMTGILDGDYHLVQDAEGHLSVVSDMSVRDMTYERSPIGNVSTELVYLQKENDAHAVEARLLKDDVEIGLLTGTYYHHQPSTDGDGVTTVGDVIDVRFLMERMPLSLVNGFVPNQLFGLQGYGEGEFSIKGDPSKPRVNGEVLLDSSYLESIPYGVKLRFDNDPVRIVDSNLLLENFTVYSRNDNPLNIQGSINFADPEKVMLNVRMRAENYQLIGAKETPTSIAYGKAFVNLYAAVRGPLDNLVMRGKLDVLGTTDMGYVLRDSPLSTDNQLDELVKFKDFSDTTQIVVERPSLTGLRMDMTVDISKGAHIMAYLNADHSNYIDLMGGGTLRLQYNPADNLRLTGRYTLSNGEMKYSLPVIPLKTFTIQDGSYIEFTGEPMNPTLNIVATERTKATVSSNGGVGHSVEFDCGVIITRTLNDMGLEFTLDAPEDLQLHSELQAMSVEQRGKLAVSMLTTGMYLTDGSTGSFSMNSALSSFLNSEINSITGNALRTLDLSFGMDNTTDASGQTHTDYSFKFAKRFLNNRLKVAVGGLVTSSGAYQQRNNSFFDNVSLEYRLDDSANKYITLFFENNSYDWLDGYTQKYGGGFIWRRTLERFTDIFRFKEQKPTLRSPSLLKSPNTLSSPSVPSSIPDSLSNPK